jgi:hypothetical protein
MRATSPHLVPLLALALLALPACRACDGKPKPAPEAAAPSAGPPGVAADGTELATLDLPELAGAKAQGAEPPQVEGFVNASGTGGVFVIRSGSTARLVHGRTASPPFPGIDLVTLSADGRNVAYAVPAEGGKVSVVLDGKPGQPFDEVGDLAFTRDGRLAYRARTGERWRLFVDRAAGEERAFVGEVRIGRDGTTVFAAERASATSPFAIAAYDAQLRRTVAKELAADELYLAPAATMAAAVAVKGDQRKVSVLPLSEPGPAREGPAVDELLGVTFDPSGAHAIYAAHRAGELVLVLDDRVEVLPAPTMVETPVLAPGGKAVGVVLVTDMAFFHLAFAPLAAPPKRYDGVTDVTFSPDGSRHAYAAEEQGRGRVVVNGAEGPVFDRVVEPRFSPDGASLVYRARQEGKRFLVVADGEGKAHRRLPDHEQVFQPSFAPDGASVGYGVKDGPRLVWKVEKLR